MSTMITKISFLFFAITSLFVFKSSAQQSNTATFSNENTIPARVVQSAEGEPAFACVKYQFTHVYDTLQTKSPDVKEMSLFISKNSSKYVEDRIYNSVTPIATVATNSEYSELAEQLSSLNNQSLGIYKKHNTANLSIVDIVKEGISLVDEEIAPINWKITTINKEIKGLKCQKAIGECKGRVYEAWFCRDYPYSTGPWKLSGLPGIIIEASDSKNQVVFSFIGYEKLSLNAFDVSVPQKINKTTLTDYKNFIASLVVYQAGDKKFKVADDGTGDPMLSNFGGQFKKVVINNLVELK